MGLGKTLTIVSLVASTLKSARKFGELDVTELDDDSSDESDADSDISASHFSGAVYGMPTGESSQKQSRNGDKNNPNDRKLLKLEAKSRRERLVTRSRGTLLVCPLTTMNNWEEQIAEHWAGSLEIVQPDGKYSVKREGFDDKLKTSPLRVYIYHGGHRKNNAHFLATFDIVITTFSTLQSEYSKQMKSSEAGSAYVSRTNSINATSEDEKLTPNRSDSAMVVDATVGQLRKNSSKNSKSGGSKVQGLSGKLTTYEAVSPLQAIEWFRIVLDEAHFIKDPKTIMCRAACYLEAERRLCLTGTPIQNKIDDVWALLKFLRFAPFDDREYWMNHVMAKARAGDSVGIVRLQALLKYVTIRRTKNSTDASGKKILDLKPRRDIQRSVILNEEEREIYNSVFQTSKKEFEKTQGTSKFNFVNMLHQILRMRQICDHTSLLNSSKMEDLEADMLEEGVLDVETARQVIKDSGLNWRVAYGYVSALIADEQGACSHCNKQLEITDLSQNEDDEEVKPEPTGPKAKGSAAKSKVKGKEPPPVVAVCGHVFCINCFRAHVYPDWGKKKPVGGRECPICREGLLMAKDVIDANPGARIGIDAVAKKETNKLKKIRAIGETLKPSSKMLVLLNELEASSQCNPSSLAYDPMRELDVTEIDAETGQPLVVKTVVFSQWTSMLDLIEAMLDKKQIGYARLDGTMKREERTEAMELLKIDKKCEVLLVSLRAGGVGLNLTAASRCYIVDPYW